MSPGLIPLPDVPCTTTISFTPDPNLNVDDAQNSFNDYLATQTVPESIFDQSEVSAYDVAMTPGNVPHWIWSIGVRLHHSPWSGTGSYSYNHYSWGDSASTEDLDDQTIHQMLTNHHNGDLGLVSSVMAAAPLVSESGRRQMVLGGRHRTDGSVTLNSWGSPGATGNWNHLPLDGSARTSFIWFPTAQHVQMWLQRKDCSTLGMQQEMTFTFVKVHAITTDAGVDTTSVPPQIATFTIEAGHAVSNKGSGAANPDGTIDLMAAPSNNDKNQMVEEYLSPVEVEVSRPDFQKKAWVAGADNLLGVWDTHKKGNDWLDVRVKLPDGMTQSSLPSGFLKWQYEGATETIPDNTVQHRFRWPGQHGVRKISISIGSSGYKKLLFVDLPDVGGVSEHEAEAISLLLPGGLASLTRFWAWKAAARLATDDSLDLGVSKGQRNALRHAYWNALASSDPMVGQDMTLMLTTAHEWDAWDAGNQQACESTMDLWNNHQGSTVQHSVLLQPNASAIWSELLQKLSSGQLWVWNADEESEHSANSKDLTIKSDRKKIFPTEEH